MELAKLNVTPIVLGNPTFDYPEHSGWGSAAVEKIERCGRICYNSEKYIKPGGAVEFLQTRILSTGHTSVTEHVYFDVVFEVSVLPQGYLTALIYSNCPYFRVRMDGTKIILTTNIRALLYFVETHIYKCSEDGFILPNQAVSEFSAFLLFAVFNNVPSLFSQNDGFKDMKSGDAKFNGLKNITPFISVTESKNYASFYIECNRVLTHELVRHRTFTFSQQSQRYIDALKNFQILDCSGPDYFNWGPGSETELIDAGETAEAEYEWYRKTKEMPAQEARQFLPNCMKADIVMTGTNDMWKHFLNLRLDVATVEPGMCTVANMINSHLGFLPATKELTA